MGLAYRRIGQVDLAREHLAQMGDALTEPIDPLSDELLRLNRSAPALRQRGVALINADRAAEAIPVLQEALASEPGDAVSMVALAAALDQTGRRDEAMAMLERCITVNPEDESAYFHRASLLADAGALDAAISSLRQALALRPNFTEAHYQIAAILMAQGRAAAAATELAALVDRYPDNIFIETQLAVALLASDDCQALRVTRHAAQRSPDRADVLLLHLRAVSLCVSDSAVLQPALGTAVRLLQARPSPIRHELVGLLYAAGDRDDQARVAFQNALDTTDDEAFQRVLRQRLADLGACRVPERPRHDRRRGVPASAATALGGPRRGYRPIGIASRASTTRATGQFRAALRTAHD
jgi:tetratricopeptide (TPR) repeat protein